MTEPLDVFKKLDKKVIKEIVSVHYKDDNDLLTSKKRSEQREALAEDTIASGISIVVNAVPLKALKLLEDDLGEVLDESDKPYNLKAGPTLKKALYTTIEEEGVEDFFNKISESKIVEFVKGLLKLKIDPPGGKSKLIETIIEQVNVRGLNAFFNRFNVKELGKWAEMSKLEYEKGMTKKQIVGLLTGIQEPKKGGKTQDVKLEKGVTADQVADSYTVADLRNWLKKKEFRSDGNLADLAERIADFLNGKVTAEDLKPSPKKDKKKKKKSKNSDDESDEEEEKTKKKKPNNKKKDESDEEEDEDKKDKKEKKEKK